MTLFHLISDQVWQNLIPILAMQPTRVVHVRSSEAKWSEVAANIEQAVRLFPQMRQTEFVDAPMQSAFPDMTLMQSHLHNIAKKWPPSVINFTGGTKLGAIGAFSFARDNKVPSFYYDSRQPNVFSGDTGILPVISDLRSIAAKISVRMALAAHGYNERILQSSTPTDDLLEFARHSSALRQQNKAAISRWIKNCREAVRATPPQPLPKPESGLAEELADAACLAKILDVDKNGRFSWKLSPVNACQLLEGGWWELFVYDRLMRTNSYSDLLWGVEFSDDDSRGETDIVGFNFKDLRLEIFSCKTERVEKPLEHVESLRNRSSEMGGNFSAAFLALFSAPSGNQKNTIARHCRTHRVELLLGPVLEKSL